MYEPYPPRQNTWMCVENSRYHFFQYEDCCWWKYQRLHKNVRIRFRYLQYQYLTLLYSYLSKRTSTIDFENHQRLLFGFRQIAYTYAIRIYEIFITCIHLSYWLKTQLLNIKDFWLTFGQGWSKIFDWINLVFNS